MATFGTMKVTEAPAPLQQVGQLSVRMRQYEEYVNAVKAGEAGHLTPEEGETTRAISLRISRAAKRLGKTANTWVRDGVVYFTVS